MIIKIKPVSQQGDQSRLRTEVYVFETCSYEAFRESFDTKDQLEMAVKQAGAAQDIVGAPEPDYDMTTIYFPQPDGRVAVRLQGQVTVFIMNDQGQTIDRFNN